MDVFECMLTRRSVKKYKDSPVAKELIEKIASIKIEIAGDVKEGDNITYSELANSIHYYDINGKEIISKGGISVDTEKLKEIGETLTVKIVEEDSAESDDTGESDETESTDTAE